MLDCFSKKYKPPLAQNFVNVCQTLFFTKAYLKSRTHNFSRVKITFFIGLSFMLFEVTLGIKFILFDVRPSKNNGVTSSVVDPYSFFYGSGSGSRV